MNRHTEHPFETVLSVSMEDICLTLRAMGKAPKDRAQVDSAIKELKGISELPFTTEDDPKMQDLLEHAKNADIQTTSRRI